MKILGSSLSGTRVEMLIKISIIVGISIIFLEIFSYISMVANSEKCQFGTNQMFKNLDMKTKQELCEDLKSIKYTNDIIRLHEPNQHYNMLNINSHGFRGEEFNIEKQDNEYRIFVVGSSMILGLGATSDNTTIPFLLKEKFRDNGFIDVTIINGGIIAANSASEVYMIDNILPKYKPDMIIVYEGYNDSWDIPIYDINPIEKDREDKRDFIEKFVKENFDYLNFPKLVYQKTHDYFEISSVTAKMIKDNAKLWKERWESTCKSHKIPIV